MSAGTFTAKYAGRCAAGCKGVKPGDEIAFTSEGTVIHVSCNDTTEHDDALTIRAGESLCGECWLVHVGECP